jgi:hypothetical protein
VNWLVRVDQSSLLFTNFFHLSISESDLGRALDDKNDELLLTIFSGLTCALLQRQNPISNWANIDRHLLPAVRARRDKLMGPMPASNSVLKWTSEEKVCTSMPMSIISDGLL